MSFFLPSSPPGADLHAHMQSALALAANAIGLSDPNPRVGCVIADAGGNVIGRGFTQQAGGLHAEIMALRDAEATDQSVVGATAFVTLEPCSHHGRTGPCCDALIEAGIVKVVASIADPNPLVSGQGFARLHAAGIKVEIGPGAAESRELNIGFFSRMVRAKPWVRMKIAASLDGSTALENGRSQWITGPAARADGHAFRQRASAVLTGIGTVLEDDPLLTVRLPGVARQPALVVVDSRLETPFDARLWNAKDRRILIYGAARDEAGLAAFTDRGATVMMLPNRNRKVDLSAMLNDLATREINELHVEAGHKLNGSLIRAGLVDELLIYLAPKLLGQGRGMTNLGPFAELSNAVDLEFISTARIGSDLRITCRPAGRNQF